MKKRLDILVTERGIVKSRELARSCIMAGEILVDSRVEDKPGSKFSEDVEIELKGKPFSYVSRGALKLEKALSLFKIDLTGKCCMDIGASTGGFTDLMLKKGANRVYSIDVGYGQLDYKLRTDPRVVCMERTNFRYMKDGDLDQAPDFASADVSFISLSKMLPPAFEILSDDGEMVCLIKPQFEAGREKVGKKGVVSDASVHIEVIDKVMQYALDAGFISKALSFSPIKGPKGNIEFLYHIGKSGEDSGITSQNVESVVREAHMELDEKK
ncbi:MAG: TlyA family RNA methyltransferase [Lachnospiraceae bacterium]|nr:TlyA family RNA methyltransferase [Lachnospiraceae bacterium]